MWFFLQTIANNSGVDRLGGADMRAHSQCWVYYKYECEYQTEAAHSRAFNGYILVNYNKNFIVEQIIL